jgi:hypothetical protein
MMSWPQYAREQDERSAIERQAKTNANVSKENLKVQWAERIVGLRSIFDQLYADLRAALRDTPALVEALRNNSPQPSTAAVPAREPVHMSMQSTTGLSLKPAPPAPPTPTPRPPLIPPPGMITSTAPARMTTDTAPTSLDTIGGAGSPQHKARRFLDKGVAFERHKNIILPGPDANNFDAAEMQIINSLGIGEVLLPERRGLSYFHLDTIINNETPDADFRGQLSVSVRVLCIGSDGQMNITEYSKNLDLKSGAQHIGLGGVFGLDTIKSRTRGDEIPKNVYLAFKLHGKVFEEVVMGRFGGDNWWKQDELVLPTR